MGDIITFSPNTGVNPSFVGRGSKIEHPDLLPVFWGSNWPGDNSVSVRNIMAAIYTLINSPYLEGIRQYGYAGPVQVRNAIIDTNPMNMVMPVPAPGISQTSAIGNRVRDYIDWYVRNEKIDNVDDNHDLLIMVFLDSSVPLPIDTDGAGNISSSNGAHSTYERSEFLDDNIRFPFAWVDTSRNNLDAIVRTFSHELVEAITNPITRDGGTGWVETSPNPGGEVTDVCDQPAIVNGVPVKAYWSIADNACIVPTSGIRRLSVSQALEKREPHDSPTKKGYVDFPIICGGGRYFDYHDRTYLTVLRINSNVQGYESPRITYKISGQPVPILQGIIEIEATWDKPKSNPLFPDFIFKTATARLVTWNPSPMSNFITITVGPNEGSTQFSVEVSVAEAFDDISAGGGSTQRTAYLDIDLKNQEIIWESSHDAAVKNCERNENLADGGGVVFGPPQPGDPPGLQDIVLDAVREQSALRNEKLQQAAKLVELSRPAMATALKALAQREE